MTGTDRALFDAMGERAQYFPVAAGKVETEWPEEARAGART